MHNFLMKVMSSKDSRSEQVRAALFREPIIVVTHIKKRIAFASLLITHYSSLITFNQGLRLIRGRRGLITGAG